MSESTPYDARKLVSVVTAVKYESWASLAAGAVALAVVMASPHDVRSGWGSWSLQAVVLAALVLLWTVNMWVSRRREIASYDAALPVTDAEPLREAQSAQRQHIRRGRVRVAVFTAAAVLMAGYVLKAPLVGALMPLIQAVNLLSNWGLARWQRRHGVVLWMPALSAVGRQAFRASPFYSTSARRIP